MVVLLLTLMGVFAVAFGMAFYVAASELGDWIDDAEIEEEG